MWLPTAIFESWSKKVKVKPTQINGHVTSASFQMPDQYVFCHLAFLEYALNMEHVQEIDLTGFDDGVDEYN